MRCAAAGLLLLLGACASEPPGRIGSRPQVDTTGFDTLLAGPTPRPPTPEALAIRADQAARRRAQIPESVLVVSGLRLGMRPDEVRRRLGAPLRTEGPIVDSEAGWTILTWVYDSTEVQFYDDSLEYLTCAASTCVTGAGVQVGDPTARIEATYGPAYHGAAERDTFLQYTARRKDCGLSFDVARDTIRALRLWCDNS